MGNYINKSLEIKKERTKRKKDERKKASEQARKNMKIGWKG
jgi:hypothetical protein